MQRRYYWRQCVCPTLLICLAILPIHTLSAKPLDLTYPNEHFQFERTDVGTAGLAIGIMVAGIIVYTAVAASAPDPVEDALNNLTKPEMKHTLAIYTNPCIIEYGPPKKEAYGVVYKINDSALLLDLGMNTKTIMLRNIRKIKDLETEAKRKSVRRISGGVLGLFGAAAFAVVALADPPVFPGAEEFETPYFVTFFLSASLVSFAFPSKAERENAKWQDRLHPTPSLSLVFRSKEHERNMSNEREVRGWGIRLSLNWKF